MSKLAIVYLKSEVLNKQQKTLMKTKQRYHRNFLFNFHLKKKFTHFIRDFLLQYTTTNWCGEK